MARRDLITAISIVLFIQPVPWFRGENTYKLPARSSPPHSSCCLLLTAQVPARSPSFLLFFIVFLCCCLLPRCGAGSSRRRPEARAPSSLPAVGALHSPSSLFFYLLSLVFLCFGFFFLISFHWIFTKGLQTRTYLGFFGMRSQFVIAHTLAKTRCLQLYKGCRHIKDMCGIFYIQVSPVIDCKSVNILLLKKRRRTGSRIIVCFTCNMSTRQTREAGTLRGSFCRGSGRSHAAAAAAACCSSSSMQHAAQ